MPDHYSAPTKHLIIGLGGTGGRIIQELRHAIAADRAPRGTVQFEFLYIDTDPQALASETREDNQKILLDTGELKTNVRLRSSLPNIAPWLKSVSLPESLAPDSSAVLSAGLHRKTARFLFACNGERLMSRITERMKSLWMSGSKDPRITFHVCCSLAGGTGSGTVVDMVAQLRHTLDLQGWYDTNYRILVYVMLPETQGETGPEPLREQARAYAALLELNALASGNLKLFDIADDGQALDLPDPVFTGCYVFSGDDDADGRQDRLAELDRIVADFIYRKTLATQVSALTKWENLDRCDWKDETAPDQATQRQRSRRFLSFGIRRLLVPDAEIRAFLASNFAQRAALQMVFNHWQDAQGFVAESSETDIQAEVRQIENRIRWKVSDEHLMLSLGILPEDVANPRWKRIDEFWRDTIPMLCLRVRKEVSRRDRRLDVLKQHCEQIFEESYRDAGGVRRFYEARLESVRKLAQFICREVELGLFEEWKVGSRSIDEVCRLLAALAALLTENMQSMAERYVKCQKLANESNAQAMRYAQECNQQGMVDRFFGQGDKPFQAATEALTTYYIARTEAEGFAFGQELQEELADQMTVMAGKIERIRHALQETAQVFEQRATQFARLDEESSVYKQRVYQPEAVDALNRHFVADAAWQHEHARVVREQIAETIGDAAPGFVEMAHKLDVDALCALLNDVSYRSVQRVHDALGRESDRVIDVNIVQKLSEMPECEARVDDFVHEIIDQTRMLLDFDAAEVARSGRGTGAQPMPDRRAWLFLPACESRPDFAEQLEHAFSAQSETAAFDIVRDDVRVSEITLMRIDRLFPLRFIRRLSALRQGYESYIAADEANRVLLHLQGEDQLQPLFIPEENADTGGEAALEKAVH
jgi:hypothetical protein